MKTGRRAGAIRERGGENFDAFGSEEGAHLLNAGGVGAIAVADEKRFGIEPEDVSGFGGGGCGDFAESWNVESSQNEAWRGPSATRFGFPGRMIINPKSVGREASWM